MDKLGVSAIVLLCILFSVERNSGEVVEMKVLRGDTITLQCNSSMDASVIEWHRNCSHVNQPELSFAAKWAPPRFSVTQNDSTKFSALRIENITEGDLGLYYCSSAIQKGEAVGQTFKVTFQDTHPSLTAPSCPPSDCGHCWILLASLCPTCALVAALVSSTCVYCFLSKKVGTKQKGLHLETANRKDNRKQDTDLCYASLDIPANRQKPRPQKKRQQNTDFSTYSDIRTGTK